MRCVAQVEEGLICYRADGLDMDKAELQREAHKSHRLGKNMIMAGDPRPHKLCDAHAIISGRHDKAAPMRAVLAWFKVRIDDAINGCWLPRNTAALPHMRGTDLENAVPHSRVHRNSYYRWIGDLLRIDRISSLEELMRVMDRIRHRLQSGAVPPNMIPARK